MPSETLTVEQAAKMLSCNVETVRRWIRSGKIHAVMPGGYKLGWRIPASEIARLMEPAEAA